MSHQGVLIAVAVFVALMLFFAPFVLRMQADANGVIDPCPQMWTAERGLYGGCMVFLPVVEQRNECLSAWPVWPGGDATP